LVVHDFGIARNEQNPNQKKRRQQSIDYRRPEKSFDRINFGEVECNSDYGREDDDAIEGTS
jgi:hypothetical protein